ncbi:C45 family autoproteolytic acyltransferase/hydolase [Kordia sp.]|uniref:C45 family autoproteolytic acyltransferase/hydolase n=1 Tax=Kordia sp. TaxID=1965332 RepID=UPI003D2871AC
MEKLKCIKLAGNPYEIGFSHGKQLKDDIQSFLGDHDALIHILRRKTIEKEQLSEIINSYTKMIGLHCPEILLELEGLSKGAEISMENAVLLQIRRELIGTNSFTLTGDCSSFAIKKDDTHILGQTIDLNGDMTAIGHVFKINGESQKLPNIILYSFAGLLGYMGMNSYGLSVCINMVVSSDWQLGIPPYLLVRKFLNCKTIEECIEVVEKIPRASSRSFTISDGKRQVILELTVSDYRIIEGDHLLHTNHYLHEDFIALDTMNIFSQNSSRQRLKLLEEKLEDGNLSLQHIAEVFADHSLYPVGICAHNKSNIHLNETVASIIMDPKEKHFYAAKGKACESVFKQFSFD